MTFSILRRVEFRDTDAAGIVHFSAYFPMMEAAEHELLRSLGLSVMPAADGGDQETKVTWPRVSASCSFAAAARFEDLLRIEVRVARLGRTSVEYRFRFTRDDQLIAEGSMTAVCCHLPFRASPAAPDGGAEHQSGGLRKTLIPLAIRELLARHQ
jgi:4-hydroxybenzoyl-CoA thioesterase/acyl-CoA thioester hydrolase